MSDESRAAKERTAGGTERRAHVLNALPWLWLGLSAVWAGVIFATDQVAWPLVVWIATTVGPLTALKARVDPKSGSQRRSQ